MTVFELLTTLGTWGQRHPRELLYGAAALPVLAGLAHLAVRRRQQHSDVMGSARWATPQEIKRAGLTAPHGVVVGRLGRQVLHDDSERHVLLCAPTGAGKGTGVIIPTLLTWEGSALILDPKDG